MYLKSIDIAGFKSFADRLRLELRPGITGVVGPNGCGKCVDGDTRVQMADGRILTIRDLVEERLAAAGSRAERWDDGWCTKENPEGIRVISLDPETLKLETRPILAFVKRTSPAHLLKITTRSGREILATEYHPLFTLSDGVVRTLKAEELKVGMPVAMPRRLPVTGSPVPLDASRILPAFEQSDMVYAPGEGKWNATRGSRQAAKVTTLSAKAKEGIRRLGSSKGGSFDLPATLDENVAKFLGYMISEGSVTAANQVRFVNGEEPVVEEFERVSRAAFGADVFVGDYKSGSKDCLIFSKALCLYLDRVFGMKIEGKSAGKKVPAQIFSAPDPVVRAFLSALFEGDGCLRHDRSQGKTSAYWEYATASRELAHGVASLLLRFGVLSLIRQKEKRATNSKQPTYRTYYSVFVYGLDNAQRLAGLLSFAGKKARAVDEVQALRAKGNPNLDLIPGLTGLFRSAARAAGIKVKPLRKDFPSFAAYQEGRCEVSRAGLAQAVELMKREASASLVPGALTTLETLAGSDVYWDAIVSVERVKGPEWVYDLSVEKTHNFVADGFIVHNSNVVESIRWCLGEGSWKSLRLPSMADVIFGGTSKRAPLSMAEVLLTFDNSQPQLPLEFSEVTVARRIFRSGESEYYLNKVQCRRKDIQELFLDTGIGEEGYSVIDQGKVEFVLSSKPEDRRALFEEAAGVSKFRAKRHEALLKLDRVELDMSRLNDNLAMILDQIKKLDAAARKARQFQKLKDELVVLEAAAMIGELGTLDAVIAQEEGALAPVRERSGALQNDVCTLQAEIGTLNIRRVERENEVMDFSQKLSGVRAEIARLEERLKSCEHRLEESRERQAVCAARTLETEGKLAVPDPEAEALRASLEGIRAAIASARDAADAVAAEVAAEEAALKALQEEQAALNESFLPVSQRVLETSRLAAKAQSDAAHLQTQARATLRELEKGEARTIEIEERLKAARAQAEAKAAERDKARSLHELADKRREWLQFGRERTARRLGQVREKLAEAQARYETAQAAPQPLYGSATQAVLDAGLPGVLGRVRDLLKPKSGFTPALHEALGERWQALVCRSFADSRAAIEYLQQSGQGRCRFLVLDALPFDFPAAGNLPLNARRLADCVEFAPEHERLARFLLGETYLQGRTVYGKHWVCGGSEEHQAAVSLPDLGELREAADALRKEEGSLSVEEAGINAELESCASGCRTSDGTLRELEKAAHALEAQCETLSSEIKLKGQDIAFIRDEAARELESMSAALEEGRRQHGAHEALAGEERELQVEIESLRARIESRKDAWNHERVRAAELRGETTTAEGRLNAAESQIARKEADRRALKDTLERLIDEAAQAKKSEEDLNVLKEELGVEIAKAGEAASTHEARYRELMEALNAARAECEAAEARLKGLQADLDALKEEAFSIEVRLGQKRSRREGIIARLAEAQLTVEEARAKAEGRTPDPEALAHLRRRIESMGPINMAAPEEYAELEQRHEFLRTQIADLEKAREDLKAAIARINATTRENFRQTFEEVRGHFRTLYATLFDGGEADLVLTNPDDLLETGVDIVAQPPGKKLQSITLLSGGEKALTSVALCFSFFMVRPSPFCMLDEVDAALDEANVERFVKLLRTFSEKSQFLIISHNKRTMEVADVIYGVTMEENGVSQMISVELNKKTAAKEAKEAAEGKA